MRSLAVGPGEASSMREGDRHAFEAAPSVRPDEAQFYAKLAHQWWDASGPLWPLHKLNSLRAEYLRARLVRRFQLDSANRRDLSALRVLDIGCGGGLLSESMARAGARV